MSDEQPGFPRLVPIIFVRDLDSEVAFYQSLGFKISYQGEEFPGFVGLECGNFDFGIEEKADFDPHQAAASFVWQMETDSFSKVIAVCEEQGLEYTQPRCYWEEWDSWEMQVQTPNGYTLNLEKHGRD